jgi:hypothetical protein
MLNNDFLLARVSLQASEREVAFKSSSEVIDSTILQALDEIVFASVHELAKSTCIPHTTVW